MVTEPLITNSSIREKAQGARTRNGRLAVYVSYEIFIRHVCRDKLHYPLPKQLERGARAPRRKGCSSVAFCTFMISAIVSCTDPKEAIQAIEATRLQRYTQH